MEPSLRALREHCRQQRGPPVIDGDVVLLNGEGFDARASTGYRSSRDSEGVYALGPVALLVREMVFSEEKKVSAYVAECGHRGWRPVVVEDRREVVDLASGLLDASARLSEPPVGAEPVGVGGSSSFAEPIVVGGSSSAEPVVGSSFAMGGASSSEENLLFQGLPPPPPIASLPIDDDIRAAVATAAARATARRKEVTEEDADREAFARPFVFGPELGCIPGADFSFALEIIDKVRKEAQDKVKAAKRAEERSRREDKDKAKRAVAEAKKALAKADAEKKKASKPGEDDLSRDDANLKRARGLDYDGGVQDEERPAKRPSVGDGAVLPPKPKEEEQQQQGEQQEEKEEAPSTAAALDDAKEAPQQQQQQPTTTPTPPTKTPVKEEKKGVPGSSSQAPQSRTVHRHQAPSSRKIEPYIIVVPSAATAPVTLLNASEFLANGRYVSSAEKRAAGTRREASVTMERVRPDGSKGTFRIVDNPTKLESREWDKIVAVFAVGPTWQFKNWKYSEPVDLFHRVLGVHVQFDDEQTPESIRHWNVRVLKLSKTKRHLDQPIALDFWRHLDDFLLKRKAMRQSSSSSARRHHSHHRSAGGGGAGHGGASSSGKRHSSSTSQQHHQHRSSR